MATEDIKIGVDFSDLKVLNDYLNRTSNQVNILRDKTDKSTNTFAKYSSEVDRLSRKFKPLYSTSKLYEKTLKDLNKAQQLGVITDKQRSVSIEELNKDFQRGTGIFSAHANMMNKGMNRAGVALQQTGYQVGDFIVQVQAGTNPMVAFSQQATQLVGVLYLLPPAALAAKVSILGLRVSMGFLVAGLGIAIPLLGALGAAFLRSGKDAKESSDEVKTFADAIDSINKKTDELNQKRLSLVTEFDPDAYKARLKQQGLIDKIVELEIRATGEKKSQAELTLNLADLFKKQLSDETKLLALALNRKKNAQERLDAVEKEKEVQEKLLDLQRATAKLAIKNIQLAKEQAADQKARVKDIQTAIDAEKKSLQDKILLAKEEVIYGKDSVHYQDLVAKLERDKYEAQLESNNILGKNKTEVLAVYDKLQLQLGALKLVNDQEKARLNLLSLQQSLMPTGLASGRGGDPRQRNTRYQQEFGYKTIDELIAEHNAKNKTNKATKKAPKDALVSLMEDLELQRELLGVEQDRASVLQELGENRSKYTQDQIQQAVDATNAIRLQTEELEKQERVADTISQSFGDAFMSIVDGTMSAKDAFRSMAADIIRELYRILVVETMVQSIKRSIFPFADGGVIQGGKQVQAYANGGVVGGPTYFPMAGGKTGLMGEAGPEAIMPLKRGKGGKLGVEASGDTGAVNIVQNFSFAANGDESVKRIIAEAAPKIANMTQQQIMDARRRGGQMRSTFG